MKKLLPIILALALAVTSIMAFGTMFTGAEDDAPVATTVTCTPDYVNGNSEYFYLSRYNDSNKGWYDTPICDQKSAASSQAWYPYCDGKPSAPYDDFYEFKSTETYPTFVVSDKANIIGFSHDTNNARPTITFVAPVSGTYIFSMGIGTVNYAWNATKYDGAQTYLQAYTVTKASGTAKHTAVGGKGVYTTVTSNANVALNAYTFTATVNAGDLVVLYSIHNNLSAHGGQKFVIKDLTATLAYTPDYANGSDEYFSFGYFDKNSFSTSPVFDKVGDFSDQWWPFADGTKQPYDDFNKFINDSYTDLRVVGSSKAKIIGLYSVAGNGNNPYFSFTAPECGTYTVSMGLGVRDWSSSSGSLATNVARIETYTEKPGSAYRYKCDT